MASNRRVTLADCDDIEVCNEWTPPCGALVLRRDRATHRRFHERLVFTDPEPQDRDFPGHRRPRPAWIGEPVEEAEAAVVRDLAGVSEEDARRVGF